MRTVRTKVYKFSELSEQAKQVAIEWWRNGETFDYLYEEAGDSLKAFAELFDIKLDQYDFQEHYRSEYRFMMEENILQLTGHRLATYIWNNYSGSLYKGKYYNSWTSKKKIFHPKVKSIIKSKETGWHNKEQWGEYWNVYRGVMLECSCPFTGVCYDMDLLDPIIKFMEKPNDRTDFKDLLEDCFLSLNKSVNSELKARMEDDAVIEAIEANEYEFTKDGNRF